VRTGNDVEQGLIMITVTITEESLPELPATTCQCPSSSSSLSLLQVYDIPVKPPFTAIHTHYKDNAARSIIADSTEKIGDSMFVIPKKHFRVGSAPSFSILKSVFIQ
jgi:hypothetical protein